MRVRRAEASGATWEPPRPVSVFVSSTFRDMQLERDAIHSAVLPRLRELADAYGTDVSVIDLRWGVDTSGTTEAEQERKVVRACLGEIDRCEPFFLSLVGERYGYVLPDDSLAGLLRTRLGLPAGRSITELEILHAVQRFGESETCLHLVRTISNAGGLSGSLHTEFLSEGGDADRQRRLREMLSRRFPDSTLPYAVSLAPDGTYDLDGFCELLYGELSSRLERLWGPPPRDGANPWEREHGLQWRAAEDAAATFAAREYELTKLLDFCDPARPQAASTLVVRGTEGSGMTTLLSRMAVEARDAHPELCVAFLSCGLTQRSSTTVGALRFLATDLFELSGLGEKGPGFDDLLGSRAEKDADDERFELGVLTNVLLLAARKRPLLLVVDGSDRLGARDGGDPLGWLPGLPRQRCRMVCSLGALSASESLDRLRATTLELATLGPEQARDLARAVAARGHKELPGAAADAIARRGTALPGAAAPLSISLAVQELLNLGREDFARADRIAASGVSPGDALAQVLRETLEELPGGAGELFCALADRAADVVGAEGRSQLEAVALLAGTSGGLREDDLVALLGDKGFSAADFALFRQLLGDSFVQRDVACWDFSHDCFRRAAWEHLVERVGRTDKVLARLAGHFMGLLRTRGEDLVARREAVPVLLRLKRYSQAAEALRLIERDSARAQLLASVMGERGASPRDTVVFKVLDALRGAGPQAAVRTYEVIAPQVLDALFSLHAPAFVREVVWPLHEALAAHPESAAARARDSLLLTALSAREPDEARAIDLLEAAHRALGPYTDPVTLLATREACRELARRLAAEGLDEDAVRFDDDAVQAARKLLAQPEATAQTVLDTATTIEDACERAFAAGARQRAQQLADEVQRLALSSTGPAMTPLERLLLALLVSGFLAVTRDRMGNARGARSAAGSVVSTMGSLARLDATTSLPDRVLRSVAASLRILATHDEQGVPFLLAHEDDVRDVLCDPRVLRAPLWTPGYELGRLARVVPLPWDAIERAATLRLDELEVQAERERSAQESAFALVKLRECALARGDVRAVREVWRQLLGTLGMLFEQRPSCATFTWALELTRDQADWLERQGLAGDGAASLATVLMLTDASFANQTLTSDDTGYDDMLCEHFRSELRLGQLLVLAGSTDLGRRSSLHAIEACLSVDRAQVLDRPAPTRELVRAHLSWVIDHDPEQAARLSELLHEAGFVT